MRLHLRFDFVTDEDYSIRNPKNLFLEYITSQKNSVVEIRYTPLLDEDKITVEMDAHGDPVACRCAGMRFLDSLACEMSVGKAWLIPELNRLIMHPCELLEGIARDFHYWDAFSDRGNYAGTEVRLDVVYEEDDAK